jgi:hypothetical protein
MHNRTGTDMSPHVAFRVLQAAERRNFTVVEDDIFCDLQVKTTPRLATLDQLNRVIYARSFSKILSGSLRVGFVAGAQDTVNELADIKMLTSITTSRVIEITAGSIGRPLPSRKRWRKSSWTSLIGDCHCGSFTIRRPGSSTTACPRLPSSAINVDLPPLEHPDMTTNRSTLLIQSTHCRRISPFVGSP